MIIYLFNIEHFGSPYYIVVLCIHIVYIRDVVELSFDQIVTKFNNFYGI